MSTSKTKATSAKLKSVKIVVLISVFAFLLIFAFIWGQRSRNPLCQSPLLLGLSRTHNQPELIAQRIISDLGGLPKTDMDIYEAMKLVELEAPLPIYPVQEWQILASSAINPVKSGATNSSTLYTLFDNEPVYHHNSTIQVTYADGDQAMLQWSSWSYGFVACPFLVSMGSGPPGTLELLP